MGMLDIEGKEYFSKKRIFADALNFLLYDGKRVIDPDKLQELDTAQIAVPFGNGARIPMQKYRDILKLWSAMMSGDVIYVLLGAELQGKPHYAMPVRDGLYDMIGYSKQVDAAKASYRKKKNNDTPDEDDSAELTVEGENLKIKLTNEEFLSGFRKEDKLIPIVTVVIYLGAEPWDAPLSLHEMFDVKDKEILKFVPDYFVNLISPANMEDEEFAKFATDLGKAMMVMKHQKEDADEVLRSFGHTKIDRDTAFFLNRAIDLKLELVEEGGGVDMCLAMQRKEQRDKIMGAIDAFRISGDTDDVITEKILSLYQSAGVTKELILSILNPAPNVK